MDRAPATQRRMLPRQRAGLALHGLAAIALVPGYLFVAPPSRWDAWPLIAVLGALAVISHFSTVPLPSGVGFDGALALMVIAVALVGPLPALEITVLPWLANAVTGRLPALRAGALANLAGYGWQAIAASVLLQQAAVSDPTSPGAIGWLIAAGAIIYTVGWAVGPAIYGPLWLGQPFRALAHSLLDMLPAGLVMIVLAALTVLLSGPLGALALAVFALIVLLPQSFLTYAARVRPVARLDRGTATRRYAHAIAVQLRLPRSERRHLQRVAVSVERRPPTGEMIDYMSALLADPSTATYDAQTMQEWWNGRGAPLGLCADEIPVAARILTVADTWSALTARGTPQLGHHEALEHLHGVAGTRLDPAVVQAARAVLGQELITADQPAPEPRLHHLRVPAPLRRALTWRDTRSQPLGG